MDSIAAADRVTWKETGSQAGKVSQEPAKNNGVNAMAMDADQVWLRVRARLRASVGEDVFTSWFARLELEEVVGDLVHLSVPTRFLCSWIQSNYVEKILEAFRTEDETIGRLHVTVRVNGQARPRLVSSNDTPRARTDLQPAGDRRAWGRAFRLGARSQADL